MEYQLKCVEKNGPWNFDNNLFLLTKWRKDLSSTNITFTHSPFWVQIWGLPFERISKEVGKKLGNSLGKFIESDRRSSQSDQAKFMRIRMDLQLDKPFWHGGKIASMEGEKFWVTFKYERLPTFCFIYGKMGHDDRHCHMSIEEHNTSWQYGDWLRENGNPKMGLDRSCSTSSGGREDRNNRVEENI